MESTEHTLPHRFREEPLRARLVISATHTAREILSPVDEDILRASSIESLSVALAAGGEVVCVTPDVSVEALLTLFLERGISGVPVVDADCKPVGMISKTDLLRKQHDDEGATVADPLSEAEQRDLRERFGPGYHLLTIARATVGEVMMPAAMTLEETAPVARAAALMVYEGIHRLPVVDVHGRVTGIVTPLDILRLLAQASGYAL